MSKFPSIFASHLPQITEIKITNVEPDTFEKYRSIHEFLLRLFLPKYIEYFIG